MFTLPWFCIRFMGLSCGLSFWQVQLLTSLMLFLSNALPNVAGMGSIETAFLLVFSSFMTSGEAMSTLMLFRIASYYLCSPPAPQALLRRRSIWRTVDILRIPAL